jgi:hypothetical protein
MRTGDKLIRIGKIVNSYYSQLKAMEVIDEVDFNLWIDSLQEPMRTHFKTEGLEKCRGVLNFQRFILELRDKGLEEYLNETLTEEDLYYWRKHFSK